MHFAPRKNRRACFAESKYPFLSILYIVPQKNQQMVKIAFPSLLQIHNGCPVYSVQMHMCEKETSISLQAKIHCSTQAYILIPNPPLSLSSSPTLPLVSLLKHYFLLFFYLYFIIYYFLLFLQLSFLLFYSMPFSLKHRKSLPSNNNKT